MSESKRKDSGSLALRGPRWPLTRPHGPASRAFVRLGAMIESGRVSLQFPDGRTWVFGEREPHGIMSVNRMRALSRTLLGGHLGFAESYMDGDWDSPSLVDLIEVAARNDSVEAATDGLAFVRWPSRLFHRLRDNTRRGSRRNIAYHYDLGNDFYARWLDPGMTYSSAYYEHPEQSLQEAQAAKNRRLAESLDLRPGHRVLEIGCGWGGLAEMLARDYGCHVTALTLSRQQHDHAVRRMREAGLSERVEIRLQDYRDVPETFDRIASVEMFEAVGERHWPVFFDVVRERLKAGGRAALQIISIEESRFERYRAGTDFIQRYIFPGGMLPSPTVLQQEIERAGLALRSADLFGLSYARTLAAWQRAFQHAWPEIGQIGFDARFKRMWEYYLAYCEAGFRTGALDVGQYVLVRT
ncbi:MAG: cyclopropane-fatty-acyl-phospholipid synthase family protein [Acetobacterales bacterium]